MNDRLTRACRRQSVDSTPIWLMRQAGRYLPEYRAIREKYSLLDICRTPELAAEVSLQPVRRFDLDAAILFSDLLVPLEPMGLSVAFVKGDGPSIDPPVATAADVDRLRTFDPRDALAFVLQTVEALKDALTGRLPVIGFVGAPFTLASYAIEGGHSRDFSSTKTFMYSQPRAWHTLCSHLAHHMAQYAVAQAEAGAAVIQVFDSWVGILSPADYREFVLPHSAIVFEALADRHVPSIHFGTGTTTLIELMCQAGGDAIGLDWRVPLDDGWRRVGFDRAIQGNLDPVALLGPVERLRGAARDVLQRAAGRPGHIFNLGHGVLPATRVEHIETLIDIVRSYTPASPTSVRSVMRE